MENKNFIDKLNEKLHNFRVLAVTFGVAGAAGILTTVLAFIFYAVDGVFQANDGDTNQIYGAVYFVMLIIYLIASITLVYLNFPFILNKEKLSPNKTFGYVSLGIAVFGLALAVMSFLVLPLGTVTYMGDAGETSIVAHAYFWIPIGLMFILVSLVEAYLLLPAISPKSYMPEPKNKE